MEVDNLQYPTIEPVAKNVYIDLDYVDTITFECRGFKETFTPEGIMSLLSSLVELNKRLSNIMELAERRDEIFQRLDAARYGFPYFGGK